MQLRSVYNVTDQKSQVSFQRKSVPHDFAMMHFGLHWQPLLTDNQYKVLVLIWGWTDRFGVTSAPLSYKKMCKGQAPYHPYDGGIYPLVMEERRFYKVIKSLKELGLLHVNDGYFAIDYSVLGTDLIQEPEVQRRVVARHTHDKYGPKTNEEAVRYVCAQLARTAPIEGHVAIETVNTAPQRDMSLDLNIQNNKIDADAGEKEMKSTDTVAEALGLASATKAKVRAKRLSRGTATDHAKLFQSAWHTAMREKHNAVAVPWGQEKVVSRVKTVIIAPAIEAGIDVEAFARFIVMSWAKTGEKYFAKFDRYPKEPAIQFVLKLAATYFEAYRNRRHEISDVQVSNVEALVEENSKLRKDMELQNRKLNAVMGAARELEKENKELKKLKVRPRPKTKLDPSLLDLDYDTRMKGHLK